MAYGNAGKGVISRLVDAARSADVGSTSPDDPLVRGFAEFGLSANSPLATDDMLRELEAGRDELHILRTVSFWMARSS